MIYLDFWFKSILGLIELNFQFDQSYSIFGVEQLDLIFYLDWPGATFGQVRPSSIFDSTWVGPKTESTQPSTRPVLAQPLVRLSTQFVLIQLDLVFSLNWSFGPIDFFFLTNA